jgi:hypothetical protein
MKKKECEFTNNAEAILAQQQNWDYRKNQYCTKLQGKAKV